MNFKQTKENMRSHYVIIKIMNSSSGLMLSMYKKIVIQILNLSSFKSCGSIKMTINVSAMCTGVHDK
jgi:hypothetical protein